MNQPYLGERFVVKAKFLGLDIWFDSPNSSIGPTPVPFPPGGSGGSGGSFPFVPPPSGPISCTGSKNECPLCACDGQTQHIVGNPINSYTGNYNYETTDLSIATANQPLRFVRSYNSQTVTGMQVYSQPLGYGWTHRYGVELTFAELNYTYKQVLLKGHGGTQFTFYDHEDGSYSPQPGFYATLERLGTAPPYSYAVTTANQTRYTFTYLTDTVKQQAIWPTPPATTTKLSLTPHYVITAPHGTVLSLTQQLTNLGNQIAITDPTGRVTRYTYDNLNRVVSVTDPLNGVTTYTYDALGNRVSVSAGHTTQYEYDALKRVVTTIDALGGRSTSVYQPTTGQLLYKADAQDRRTDYGYDSLGRSTVITNALGQATQSEYDDLGRLSRRIEASGKVTLNEYDVNGNLSQVTENYQPDDVQNQHNEYNLVTRYAYNLAGQPIMITDTLNRVTWQKYDRVGHLVERVAAILILESIGLKPNAKSSNALKRVTFLARFSALELLACGFNHR